MSVSPITQKFDRDVDTVLTWMHEDTQPMPMVIVHAARHSAETETLPAFGAMLPGPASVLDAVPQPTIIVKCQRSIGWAFVAGFSLGALYMAGLAWLI